MDNFGNRIKRLEQQSKAGDGAMIAALLRLSNAEGATMQSAIEQLEKDRGRPLHPDLVERAKRLAGSIRNMARALFQVVP